MRLDMKVGKTCDWSRECAERQEQHRHRIGIGRGDAGERVLRAGPYCIANTPGGLPLVTRAKPSAMSTPTRSCRQMIGRMPAATAFSMIEVVGKQNSVVTPSRFRTSTMASAVRLVGGREVKNNYAVIYSHLNPSPHRLTYPRDGDGKCAKQHCVLVSHNNSRNFQRVAELCSGS